MVTVGLFHVGRLTTAPASASPFPPRANRGYSTVDSPMRTVAPRWEVYGVLGGGRPPMEFRLPALAGLRLLPRADVQFRRNRERMPAAPNGSASSSRGIWGMRSPRLDDPGGAAAQPAALPAPPFRALTIAGRALRARQGPAARLLSLDWSAD
jgi:hypothetical protein